MTSFNDRVLMRQLLEQIATKRRSSPCANSHLTACGLQILCDDVVKYTQEACQEDSLEHGHSSNDPKQSAALLC